MTTRSGLLYGKQDTVEMAEGETATRVVSMEDLLRALAENQQRQVEAEERRREAEERAKGLRFEEEQRRRKENERQMALIARLLERTTFEGHRDQKPKERVAQVVRLSEDDIETYLTTFERVMEAYEVDKDRWAFKLAPYLSGRAQEVHGSLSSEQAADYEQLKEAILHRYGIREETYRKRFRAMKATTEETYKELGSRLRITAKKWLRECQTIEDLLDVIVKEQFVNCLPSAIQIWI